jgi:hypothetical protein
LKNASDAYYGLSSREMLKFAFDYAVTISKKIPERWGDVKAAGTEWFTKFLKRYKSLSLHKAEATSVARAFSFYKTNVNAFFFTI